MDSAAAEVVRVVAEMTICDICYDILDKPLVLACQHFFCACCLRQWVKTQGEREGNQSPGSNHPIICPKCRARSHTVSNNVSITALAEAVTKLKSLADATSAVETGAARQAHLGTETDVDMVYLNKARTSLLLLEHNLADLVCMRQSDNPSRVRIIAGMSSMNHSLSHLRHLVSLRLDLEPETLDMFEKEAELAFGTRDSLKHMRIGLARLDCTDQEDESRSRCISATMSMRGELTRFIHRRGLTRDDYQLRVASLDEEQETQAPDEALFESSGAT